MNNVTLKEHFEARFAEIEKRLKELNSYQQQALNIAKSELERRLSAMNEFREQLSSQATTFLTRERFESESTRICEKIEQLQAWKSQQEGKQSRSNIISIIAMIVSAMFAILHLLK